VTEVDFLEEAIMLKEITKVFPLYQVHSEEAGDNNLESDWLWLIDPLDGTNNYAIGLSVFAVSITLMFQKKPVLGVVFEPMPNRLLVSTLDGKAYCNGIETNQFIKPNAKVNRILALLSEQYLIGVITNGTPDFQRNKIKQMGIGAYFKDENLFISEEVGYSKPAKEIYQMALNHFQVTADEVIFVGDSLKNDVIAPMHYGMRAIWVNNHNESLPADVTPYATITAIEQLESILL
jgi:HAD superfamily hydrolase (TIGR01509 family)